MKVLLVARSFTRGGAATGAANLGNALEAAGPDVIRVSADAAPSRLRTTERVIERLLFDAETHCLRLGAPSIDLPAEVAKHHPDIVQLCDLSANTIDMGSVASLAVPTIHRMSDFWPYHGPSHYAEASGEGAFLARKLFALGGYDQLTPTARVAPSDWLADRVQGTRPEVIPNAVAEVPSANTRMLSKGPVRLGFISGKLHDPRKGLDRLLNAFQSLPQDQTVLHLYGAGTEAADHDRVVNKGRFDRADLARVYDEIDILICPSRRDNSPNTVTEALSFGVPVIGQIGTGMETYVSEEHGALLDFWGETIPDLKRAIAGITTRYTAYSNAALKRARSDFAPATVGQAYKTLYEKTLTGV